jgi:hypothetical protein
MKLKADATDYPIPQEISEPSATRMGSAPMIINAFLQTWQSERLAAFNRITWLRSWECAPWASDEIMRVRELALSSGAIYERTV